MVAGDEARPHSVVTLMQEKAAHKVPLIQANLAWLVVCKYLKSCFTTRALESLFLNVGWQFKNT